MTSGLRGSDTVEKIVGSLRYFHVGLDEREPLRARHGSLQHLQPFAPQPTVTVDPGYPPGWPHLAGQQPHHLRRAVQPVPAS